MKSTFKITILIMLSFALMSSACSSDDDGSNNMSSSEIINTAQSGTWRITSFIDSGEDETNHFIGYNFTFGDNNVLTATNNSNSQTGTWSVTGSSSPDFNIFFPVPESNPFEDLNDDWDIVTVNNNTISLIDVSGGNGGTDTLVFQKN